MDASVLQHDVQGQASDTVVLLPGGLTGWQSWQPLLPLFAREHRVVNVQLLANAEGATGRVGVPTYTTDVERESLLLTVDALGLEQVHLVGWSNGGRAALDFALAHPARVRSVTVVEPAAWWLAEDIESSAEFDRFIRSIAGRNLTEEDVAAFAVRAGVVPAGTDVQALPGWPVWYERRNSLSWFGDAAIETAQAGIQDLERLDQPALCVRGTTTADWLSVVVARLVERLPNASLLELPGGHACLLQNPDDFASAVSSHVRRASTGDT
jgi:pimeloyl-ACP methyl ester carboxylesterase